jgi:hypothetical protein
MRMVSNQRNSKTLLLETWPAIIYRSIGVRLESLLDFDLDWPS